MAKKAQKDQFSESEQDQRDELLRGLLRTPPQPRPKRERAKPKPKKKTPAK